MWVANDSPGLTKATVGMGNSVPLTVWQLSAPSTSSFLSWDCSVGRKRQSNKFTSPPSPQQPTTHHSNPPVTKMDVRSLLGLQILWSLDGLLLVRLKLRHSYTRRCLRRPETGKRGSVQEGKEPPRCRYSPIRLGSDPPYIQRPERFWNDPNVGGYSLPSSLSVQSP